MTPPWWYALSLGRRGRTCFPQGGRKRSSVSCCDEFGGHLPEPLGRFSQVSELVGIGAALVVLLVFGSVLATILPVLGAVIGVLAGVGVLGLAAAGCASDVRPGRPRSGLG